MHSTNMPVMGRVYHCFEGAKGQEDIVALLADAESPVLEHGKEVKCAYCRTTITYQGNAESIQGKHIHYFSNPSGYAFTIACYRRAWCKVMGQPTLEWTWFTGYTWQYALCPQCREHLGWFYHSEHEQNRFYGLILDRLLIEEATPDNI